jgi:hypothetical protein
VISRLGGAEACREVVTEARRLAQALSNGARVDPDTTAHWLRQLAASRDVEAEAYRIQVMSWHLQQQGYFEVPVWPHPWAHGGHPWAWTA